ncbi:hypothetical protein EDD18DRAFT_1104862 [Armillaria luteobubalina]|uniref:Uncharacterized protein n=1 Tax=Armillaria luteobubalina TaxID=153913 RepID=A0AA39UXT7_9AGAR|nr:hypothetical protein EDD18DRAFT_1104862 [Armillaria luteobubalina]
MAAASDILHRDRYHSRWAFNLVENVGYLVVYLSCILATTVWCTILFVLRIVTVIRAQNGMDTKLGDYRRVIEVLVESSALHSVTLIIFVALKANGSFSSGHFDILAVMTTGIPLGRVAAGHARPDDSWEGSIISSLGFEVNAETYSQVSFISDDDLEAQSIQLDEPGGIASYVLTVLFSLPSSIENSEQSFILVCQCHDAQKSGLEEQLLAAFLGREAPHSLPRHPRQSAESRKTKTPQVDGEEYLVPRRASIFEAPEIVSRSIFNGKAIISQRLSIRGFGEAPLYPTNSVEGTYLFENDFPRTFEKEILTYAFFFRLQSGKHSTLSFRYRWHRVLVVINN